MSMTMLRSFGAQEMEEMFNTLLNFQSGLLRKGYLDLTFTKPCAPISDVKYTHRFSIADTDDSQMAIMH